jgi:hypothetical protein
MGQYHIIYNKTKKEYFSIGGAKLLEKSFDPICSTALMLLLANSNGRGGGDINIEYEYTKDFKKKPLAGKILAKQQALDLIAGRWAGDKIVIQGDYATKEDPAFISDNSAKDYTNITREVLTALAVNDELRELISKDIWIKFKPEF